MKILTECFHTYSEEVVSVAKSAGLLTSVPDQVTKGLESCLRRDSCSRFIYITLNVFNMAVS